MTEKDICPYCQQEMKEEKPLTARLSPRQFGIFEAIVRAGPGGVSALDLISEHLEGKSNTTLRTAIHGINQVIVPLKLAAKGGRYRLYRQEWLEGSNASSDKNEVENSVG